MEAPSSLSQPQRSRNIHYVDQKFTVEDSQRFVSTFAEVPQSGSTKFSNWLRSAFVFPGRMGASPMPTRHFAECLHCSEDQVLAAGWTDLIFAGNLKSALARRDLLPENPGGWINSDLRYIQHGGNPPILCST